MRLLRQLILVSLLVGWSVGCNAKPSTAPNNAKAGPKTGDARMEKVNSKLKSGKPLPNMPKLPDVGTAPP